VHGQRGQRRQRGLRVRLRLDTADARDGDGEARQAERSAELDGLTRLESAGDPLGAHGPAKVVYRGTATAFRDAGLRVGAKYQYTVTAFDQASNAAARTLPVTATGALINPVPGQRVTSPPRLAWLPVKGASYYNVQLIRDGRILSAWPTRANYKLPRSWIYHGRRYRMRAGVYRWYVWPGFGKLAQARYGRLLGRSSFVYAG
jgi:hypothetical protein